MSEEEFKITVCAFFPEAKFWWDVCLYTAFDVDRVMLDRMRNAIQYIGIKRSSIEALFDLRRYGICTVHIDFNDYSSPSIEFVPFCIGFSRLGKWFAYAKRVNIYPERWLDIECSRRTTDLISDYDIEMLASGNDGKELSRLLKILNRTEIVVNVTGNGG